MKIDDIAEVLRRGVQHIISRASPPCGRELKDNYAHSSHPHREFLFVLDGECKYLCNDSVYPCTPGTLMLVDSGLSHGSRYTKEDHNLLHMWGYFFARTMHVSVFEVTEYGQYRPIPELFCIYISDELFQIVEKRWNLLTQAENLTEDMVEKYMKGPINAVLEEVAFRLTTEELQKTKYTAMETIKSYILSRNGRACSLKHLAELSGYQRCYLAYKFHEDTGMTIGQYIEEVRIKFVQTALKRGVHQKEIAYELGFSSPSSFWNWLQTHKKELKQHS